MGTVVSQSDYEHEEPLAMESDHDLVIRLYERMEQVMRNHYEMQKNVAKIEMALEKLERDSASLKFGWKVLIAIGSATAGIAGIAADFLFHR